MRNKLWIAFLSILLLLLMCFLWPISSDTQEELLFSLQLSADDGSETVHCHKAEDGQYYVFLPCYAKLQHAKIQMSSSKEVKIGEYSISDGMSCSVFEENISYLLRVGTTKSKIMFLKSSEVAAMHIDTQTGSLDYIHAQKNNEELANIRLYTAEGEKNYSGTKDTMRGRGNYTWRTYEKKPYAIQLAQEADLLNMGAAQSWVLLANAADASHMKNKFIYDFASKIGLPYSPQSDWVELYINGEYQGLYLLCERIEVHPERVNVPSESSVLVSLELDQPSEGNDVFFSTNAAQTLQLRYPENVTQDGLVQISQMWQNVENALLSADGVDPVSGKHWSDLIDVDSWMRKYIIEEMFANSDACYRSQYFYYDPSADKIYAGPVWDYDRSLGEEELWQLQYTTAMHANRLVPRWGYETPWFYQLYNNEEFYRGMTTLYRTQILPALQESLSAELPAYERRIETAVRADAIRWNVAQDYSESVQNIVSYLDERTDFLCQLWEEEAQYHTVRMDSGNQVMFANVMVRDGETLPQLPNLADSEFLEFVGWYCVETEEPFDKDEPITQDISIYAKWKDTSYKKAGILGKLAPVVAMTVVFFVIVSVEARRTIKKKK